VTVGFIDERKDEFGVAPICEALQVAPSTYYAARSRPPSARAVDDERLTREIERVHAANYQVYGRRKVWTQLRREGIAVGRDRVARLMRAAGLCGVVRGRTVRTTRPDTKAARAPDLVDRDWAAAQRPNHTWVSDFTYVPTWAGVVYVAFVIDVFSRFIVGWRAATSMRTDLVLDALEMAVWQRDERLDGLVCHSDAGSLLGFKGS
jgi:putative transposase